MKQKIFNIILIGLISSVILNIFGIFNTMVSLKYETHDPEYCLSIISGINLCDSIFRMKLLIAIAILLICFLLYFKNKILKAKDL